MTAQKIPASVLKDVSAFLDPKYSVDDVFAVLGMELDALEALDKPKSFDMWMVAGIDTAKMKESFKRKGREFLAKYRDALVANVCDWWKDNRDKVGEKLVAGLSAVVIVVLPPPANAIAGIVALIVAIFFKSGFDAICGKKPAKKPK